MFCDLGCLFVLFACVGTSGLVVVGYNSVEFILMWCYLACLFYLFSVWFVCAVLLDCWCLGLFVWY